MARETGPVWKQSRRLGFSVLETGEELRKRTYAPGQHGPNKRVKRSAYGQQLAEKQKIRYMYGLSEKQFANTFYKAVQAKGVTGTVFLQLLESRLDNIVYRMGLARTRRGARQFVNHGHVLVNGKKVDIPSYQCKPGDVIEVRDNMKNAAVVKDALEATLNTPDFVTFDANTMKGQFVRLPERRELNQEVNELLVVEYYNRKM